MSTLHAVVVPQPPTIVVDAPCGHAFKISRLCAAGRWFREVGYTVPILSNDARFDATWSCETPDREFGEALVREREARASVERLRELGCASLSHSGRRLTATLGRRPHALRHDKEHKAAVRAELDVLGGVVSRLCERRTFPHEGSGGLTLVVAVLLGLAFVAGLMGLASGASDLLPGALGGLALRSLLVSVPLVLLLTLAMALLLAGRSAAHKELGLVVLVAVLALPALGIGGAVFINRALDDGAATVRRVPVLELQEHHGEGDEREYFAVVPDWREGGDATRRIEVSRETAAGIVPGETWLRLTTSPGRLEAERLLSLVVEEGSGG